MHHVLNVVTYLFPIACCGVACFVGYAWGHSDGKSDGAAEVEQVKATVGSIKDECRNWHYERAGRAFRRVSRQA